MIYSILRRVFRKKYKKRIVCAAIHFSDGKIYKRQSTNITDGFVVGVVRHYTREGIEPFLSLAKNGQMTFTCGFLTNENEFVDRAQAAKIAYDAGQIRHKVEFLYSDHLY